MESPVAARRPNLPALTGLRAVAALLVVLFHYKYIVPGLGQSTAAGARVIQSGFVGVSLFFVLSGFILAYTYIDDNHTLRGSWSDFIFARFARVYPVYVFALLIALPIFIDISLVHPVGVMKLKDTLRTAFLTPLLLQGWTPKRAWMWNGPGWSLSAEAFFYLLFPVIGIWIARQSSKKLGVLALVACIAIVAPPLVFAVSRAGGIAVVTSSSYGSWVAFLKFSPLIHLPQFVIGIITGVAFIRRRRPSSLDGWLSIASVAAIIVVLASSHHIPYLLLQGGLLAPLFAVMIYTLACGRGIVCKLLSQPAAVRMGEASYALYLIHMPLSWYVTRGLRAIGWPRIEAWIGLAGFVAIAVASSLAVFALVERPSRVRLQAWYRQRGGELRSVEALRRYAATAARVLNSSPRAAISLIRADG
jgi:peptidoglycan/LPS O-acetylase OafA/YrhL